MAKHTKRRQISDSIQADAMRIARGTQRPGQTKEQTKLIAQGIKKGIEQYKKQQSAKSRELDKKLKKTNQQSVATEKHKIDIQEKMVYRQHWLPWVLLFLSWLAMSVYWFIK